MLALLGDIHGEIRSLAKAHDLAKASNATALIQLGDLGFSMSTISRIRSLQFDIPVYALDGNHEDFRLLRGITNITEFAPNFWYVPRGTLLELDGRRIACLGGAGSIDKDIRLAHGWHWFPDEQITSAQVEQTIRLDPVDILLTHGPPQQIVTKHWDTPEGIKQRTHMFGVAPDWKDPSLTQIDRVWESLRYPPLYCGHMHRSLCDGNVRILDINELVMI